MHKKMFLQNISNLNEFLFLKFFQIDLLWCIKVYLLWKQKQILQYQPHSLCQATKMKQQAKWFIKTQLQTEQFYHYEDPNPKEHEIKESIQIIRKYFPDTSICQLVVTLYESMREVTDSSIIPPQIYHQICKDNIEISSQVELALESQKYRSFRGCLSNNLTHQSIQKLSFSNSTKRSIPMISLEGQNERVLIKYPIQNHPIPNFKSAQQQQIFTIKQIIIDSFISKGYGMPQFRQYLTLNAIPFKMEYKNYSTTVTSITMEGFRAMEKFLETNCSIFVRSIAKTQLRMLYSILLNLKERLSQQDYSIYRSFLQSVYNLCPPFTKVTAFSVYNSYQAILKLLTMRIKEEESIRNDPNQQISVYRQQTEKMFRTKQTNSVSYRDQPNRPILSRRQAIKKWSPQSQNQLALFYIELQDLTKIRERYRQIYGCITMFQNMSTLRSYLYKMIRKSLRKVQKTARVYADKFVPEVSEAICLKSDEKYVQYVLTSPEFVATRVLLCKHYISKEKDFSLIEQLAKSMAFGLNVRLKSQKSIISKSK